MPEEEARGEEGHEQRVERQQVTQFVDKTKEIAGSVAEKAGPWS